MGHRGPERTTEGDLGTPVGQENNNPKWKYFERKVEK